MKRSEMAKRIESVIWNKLEGSVEPGPGIAALLSWLVLKEIEKAEMMPPPLNHDDYRWEPEDETK